MTRSSLVLGLSLVALLATRAAAHPIEFGVMTLQERDDGRYDLELRFSGGEETPERAAPWFDEGCALESVIDVPLDYGLHVRGLLRCEGGLVGKSLGIRGLTGTSIEVPLTITTLRGEVQSSILTGAEPRIRVEADPARSDVFRRYLMLGVEHIAIGVDHLLLVLGLMLASRGVRQLLLTVSAFTLGHSITLGLASLDLVHVPGPPVEACIALSLVLLAVSLVRGDDADRASPPLLAVTFGLLHGFGFAGALAEIGLPRSELGLALFGFNLGVELGQVAFVAIASVVAFVGRKALGDAPRERLRILVPQAIGALSVYFLLERLATLGS